MCEYVDLDPDEKEYYRDKTTNFEMLRCEKLYHLYKEHGIFEQFGAKEKIMRIVDEFFDESFMSRIEDGTYDCVYLRYTVWHFIREAEMALKIMKSSTFVSLDENEYESRIKIKEKYNG